MSHLDYRLRYTGHENQREHEPLLRKLQQVFRDGYRPARGRQSYRVKLDNGLPAYQQVNCLGHIFNLRNEQFNDYNFMPYGQYGHFPRSPWDNNQVWAQKMLDFIAAVGLEVAACDPVLPITDFKSWKIALYFSPHDFHYLLEDTPQNWSSKWGFSDFTDRFHCPGVPQQFHCRRLTATYANTYYLHGTYQITNPYADENNAYVQDHVRD